MIISVVEPELVELKLFGDLEPEPEPKTNLKKHFLQSVWRMLGRRKANFYSFIRQYIAVAGAGAGAEIMDKVGAVAKNK